MASLSWLRTLKSTIYISLLVLQFSLIKGHGGGDDEDSSSNDNADLHAKGLILVKIWCLIILLVSTFAGGVSPYFYRWNESFLLLGTQFAGGVFLGTSLMHFLSDSTDTFSSLTTKTYPFSFMLASSGYLLTMLGDCIVSLITKGNQRETSVVQAEVGRVVPDDDKEVGQVDLNPVLLRTTSLGDTILLILALCFHSVFEGIAVGVAGTTFSYCFNTINSLFVSFLLHCFNAISSLHISFFAYPTLICFDYFGNYCFLRRCAREIIKLSF